MERFNNGSSQRSYGPPHRPGGGKTKEFPQNWRLCPVQWYLPWLIHIQCAGAKEQAVPLRAAASLPDDNSGSWEVAVGLCEVGQRDSNGLKTSISRRLGSSRPIPTGMFSTSRLPICIWLCRWGNSWDCSRAYHLSADTMTNGLSAPVRCGPSSAASHRSSHSCNWASAMVQVHCCSG